MSAASKIESAVAQPHQMATVHDKGLIEEDEYEYVMNTREHCVARAQQALTGTFYSYEGLPPNFSLAANMAAGAFAGIAV